MPLLSRAQRRTGLKLGSRSVAADNVQTRLCTYLSAVLLGGLVLNATLGWGWADPLDQDVVDALVAVASGLKSLGIATADGLPALSTAVQVAILRSCDGLSLYGVTYTPAAVERLSRKAALA